MPATLGGGLAVTLLTWPRPLGLPGNLVDSSWQAGISMAFARHLHFGSDVVFTYGPLGFLSTQVLYFSRQAPLIGAYSLVVQLAIVCFFLYLIGKRKGAVWAIVVTLPLAALMVLEIVELVPILFFVVASAVLLSDDVEHLVFPLAISGSVLAAFQLLVKFDTGVALLVLDVVLAFALTGTRRVWGIVAVPIVFAGTLVGGWVLSHQAIGALGSWLRGSFDLANGYSSAMATEGHALVYQYPLALAAIAALSVVAIRGRVWERTEHPRVLLALAGAFLFLLWKHGFVRHDQPHVAIFFAALLMTSIVLWAITKTNGALIVTACLLVVVALVLPGFEQRKVVRPLEGFRQIRTLFVPGASRTVVDRNRASIRRTLSIDATTAALLAGRGVHVDPYQTLVVWALDLEWRPPPVFQTYSAYTARLDHLNAEALSGPNAPDRILRSLPTVPEDSERNPMFESPEYISALLCTYSELRAAARWEVLGRTPSRCDAPRPLAGPVSGSRSVAIPPGAGEGIILLVRIESHVSLLERALTFLYRPPRHHYLELDYPDGSKRFRLVEGTEEAPLVLCVPPSAGFNARFVEVTCPSALRVLNENGPRVTFLTRHIGPPAAAAG